MCVHTWECVFTCLCIAPIAPLKNVPWGSVLAKWEPRTEAWYELAERKEVRKTKACLDCKQNQDRGRWTEAMPTHRVSTYVLSRPKQSLLGAQSRHLQHTPSLHAKQLPHTPWTPHLQPMNASSISIICTDMCSDSALVWFHFLCHSDPEPFSPQGAKQQAADSRPADSRALAVASSCHSLIM